MTEPVFEIISRKRTQSHKSKQESSDSYAKLMEEYLSKSYGYYIELFLKRICQKAQQQHQKLLKFQLRKLLRQFVSKYMMTDLEIIFFSYFADLHQWNFAHSVIQKSITKNQANNELNQINEIRLFLHLVCFFVKSYVGDKAEVSALIEFHNQNLPLFCEIYQMWVQNNDKKVFQISPRDLNQIYSEHSRNCGQKSTKRDYNKMVDRILDLSTSYSMVPAKQKSSKQRKSSSRVSRQQIPQVSQYAQMPQPSPQKVRSMRQIQPSNIWQQQNSFRFDFSDLRFSKRQSIVLSNLQQQKASGSRVDQSNNSGKGVTGGHKKISLNKKKKDEVNNMAKNFFRGKDINVSVQDIKKNENSLRDIMPNSFLDLNGHSSRIESLPIPYRNNSNLFGPSTLF